MKYVNVVELNCCPDCGSHIDVVDWNKEHYSCDGCKTRFKENIIKYKRIVERYV